VRQTYKQRYFETRRSAARQSADIIAPYVRDLIQPSSILDLGCGTGSWLAAFGVDDVVGVDGEWVPDGLLEIPSDQFRQHDLRQPFDPGRTFALALSIEAGEHLPESSADLLVDELARAAPVVLFSAAIPYQGGTGHVNSQWPSWWATKFKARGLAPVDCVRPRFWAHPDVRFFHAQNLILYVRHDRLAEYGLAETPVMDLVHPRLVERLLAPRGVRGWIRAHVRG
jgi:SAM-dependent methyltransferase